MWNAELDDSTTLAGSDRLGLLAAGKREGLEYLDLRSGSILLLGKANELRMLNSCASAYSNSNFVLFWVPNGITESVPE